MHGRVLGTGRWDSSDFDPEPIRKSMNGLLHFLHHVIRKLNSALN
jgi:hypothetical protein